MNKKQSKLQIARTLSQLLFLILLIVGIYMDIRMVIIILLPLTLFFGNFFYGWVCSFGFVQELMGKIGYKIFKKRYKMPKKVQNIYNSLDIFYLQF